MFKHRPLIILLLVFSACDASVKESEEKHKEEVCRVEAHDHVMHETDSILVLADEGFEKMKQRRIKQDGFVDSLEFTIKQEQYTINNINRELDRRVNIEHDLQLTRQELEVALIECRKTKKDLKALSERFESEVEFYIDKEFATREFCNREIDSLRIVLEELKAKNVDTVFISRKLFKRKN